MVAHSEIHYLVRFSYPNFSHMRYKKQSALKHSNLIISLKHEYILSGAKFFFIVFICSLKYQCDFESMGLLPRDWQTTANCISLPFFIWPSS